MARICMVAYTNYQYDPRPRREAEALVARGDTVDFISLSADSSEQEREFNGVRLHELAVNRYRGESSGSYLRTYLTFFLKAARKITALHLRNRFDIIQVHTMPDFMVFTAFLPRLLGAKVILDVHDLMPEAYMAKFGKSHKSLLIRLITMVERMSVGFADRAIAVHIPHREVLVQHGNSKRKFSILLNLPDPNVFRKEIPRAVHRQGEPFRLIYHGIVTRRNGLETAIRAIDLARQSVPVEMEIIGGGDDVPRLQRLVKELGLEGTVSLSGGYIPMDELMPHLSRAHFGLVTLLYDEVTRHMLPTKLLEYVSLGIPVAVARTETIQTYFDDDMVRYYTPGDETELARIIVELYQNPEERERLVSSAERFNTLYSWDNQKKDYYRLIDSLLPAG